MNINEHQWKSMNIYANRCKVKPKPRPKSRPAAAELAAEIAAELAAEITAEIPRPNFILFFTAIL